MDLSMRWCAGKTDIVSHEMSPLSSDFSFSRVNAVQAKTFKKPSIVQFRIFPGRHNINETFKQAQSLCQDQTLMLSL